MTSHERERLPTDRGERMLTFMSQGEDPDAMFQFLGAPLVSRGNPYPGCIGGMYPIRLESLELIDPLVFRTVRDATPTFTADMVSDMGDCPMNDGQAITDDVFHAVQNGTRPIVVGGDDEVSYHVVKGVQKATQSRDLMLVTFDAHYDTEDEDLYHGSWVRQCVNDKLVSSVRIVGQRGATTEDTIDWLKSFKDIINTDTPVRDRDVVLCVDMDVFRPADAPGVGYRVPGGNDPASIYSAIEYLSETNNVLAMAVTELNPDRDQSGITAVTALGAIYHYMAGCLASASHT